MLGTSTTTYALTSAAALVSLICDITAGVSSTSLETRCYKDPGVLHNYVCDYFALSLCGVCSTHRNDNGTTIGEKKRKWGLHMVIPCILPHPLYLRECL